jgi:hypothetical protein
MVLQPSRAHIGLGSRSACITWASQKWGSREGPEVGLEETGAADEPRVPRNRFLDYFRISDDRNFFESWTTIVAKKGFLLSAAVHGHKQVVQRFRQGRVRENTIAQGRVGKLAHDGNL